MKNPQVQTEVIEWGEIECGGVGDMRQKASKSVDEMREVAARICRDYLNGTWKTVSAEDIHLRRISGGLSNFLYYVSLPDNNDNNNTSLNRLTKSSPKRLRKDSLNNVEPKEVLLRIYGQTHGEHALETMLTESVVFTLLSERNLGPKLHGIFPGGRIEQFIPARALTTVELSNNKISMKIAEKMAQIHSLSIPVSKEPDWLWNTMSRWMKTAENVFNSSDYSYDGNISEKANELRNFDFNKEVVWLKSIIENADYPVVFSHNDLQEGNILLKQDISRPNSIETLSENEETSTVEFFQGEKSNAEAPVENGNVDDAVNENIRKRSLVEENICDLDNTRDSVYSCNSQSCDPDLLIIDYEYCAYNYRGFDLANHFLEWTFDYTNDQHPFYYHKKEQYPSQKQQIDFIMSYLTKFLEEENYKPNSDDVDEVIEEVKCFTMVSHLFWTLWAIVNVHQDIEFGYWEYAISRLREYYSSKEEYIKFAEALKSK